MKLSSTSFLSLVLLPMMSALKSVATPTPAMGDVDMDMAEGQGQLLLSPDPVVDMVEPQTPDASWIADQCPKRVDCGSCLSTNGCGWNQVTFECSQGRTGGDKVANSRACALMAQMQRAFPQVKVRGRVTKRAGVVPQEFLAVFASIQHHIFDGEPNNPDAGRHILSSFRTVHPNLQPQSINNANHLQQFSLGPSNVKTVWVDTQGLYTRLDIQNICVTAAKLLNGHDDAGKIGVVVQSHFSFPACVTFAKFQGRAVSCFALGVFGAPQPGKKKAKVGERCNGPSPI